MKIILLGAAPIDGELRYPSEGSLDVASAVAEDLIKVGLAKADNLNQLKAEEVRDVALEEGANIGPASTKSEVVEAIRGHRANA